MATPCEFREYAIKCERLSNRFPPGDGREALLAVAARWHRMADDHDAHMLGNANALKPAKVQQTEPEPGKNLMAFKQTGFPVARFLRRFVRGSNPQALPPHRPAAAEAETSQPQS